MTEDEWKKQQEVSHLKYWIIAPLIVGFIFFVLLSIMGSSKNSGYGNIEKYNPEWEAYDEVSGSNPSFR